MKSLPTPCKVWVPADHRGNDALGLLPYIFLDEKYARAVKFGVGAQPVLFPLVQAQEIKPLLNWVDGVMLTGSQSNVHPSHFEEPVLDENLPLDPARDALTLALVLACLQEGVPLLGICRGFQEINVALGGSLHQAVHHVPQFMDHREDAAADIAAQYGLSHPVSLKPGSQIDQWAQAVGAHQHEIMVNSLHGQGVNRLAAGLTPVAHAADGLIEAFEVTDAKSFAFAAQWHPEWRFEDYPFYAQIFKAFGAACRERALYRLSSNAFNKVGPH